MTLIDQLTKVLVLGAFQLGDGLFVTEFLNLVRAHNRGAAFSFLDTAAGWQRWLFIALGLAAAGVIISILKQRRHSTLFAFALSLILGGAIGNVIDRVWHGYVVDFVQVHAGSWYFPAFNVADAGITVGAGMLLLAEFLRGRQSVDSTGGRATVR